MKKLLVLLLSLVVVLAACGGKEDKDKTVKIGVTGIDSKVWEVVKEEAKKKALILSL